MRALDEINLIVKKAQDVGFERMYLEPGSIAESSARMAEADVLRGVSKGLYNAIPGFADGVSWLMGLGDKAKRYISDPLRKVEMAAGGKHVKDFLDKSYAQNDDNIRRQLPPPMTDGEFNREYWQYVNDKANGRAASDAIAAGTEVAATWPLWGRAIGLAGKAVKPVLGPVMRGAKAVVNPVVQKAKEAYRHARNWGDFVPRPNPAVQAAPTVSAAPARQAARAAGNGTARGKVDLMLPAVAGVSGMRAGHDSYVEQDNDIANRQEGLKMVHSVFTSPLSDDERKRRIADAGALLGREGTRELIDSEITGREHR